MNRRRAPIGVRPHAERRDENGRNSKFEIRNYPDSWFRCSASEPIPLGALRHSWFRYTFRSCLPPNGWIPVSPSGCVEIRNSKFEIIFLVFLVPMLCVGTHSLLPTAYSLLPTAPPVSLAAFPTGTQHLSLSFLIRTLLGSIFTILPPPGSAAPSW